MLKKYVLGFLFNPSKNLVWLIRKEKPEWQKGLLNGIGGQVEEGEKPEEAMTREFKEEAWLIINDWKFFCSFTDDRGYVVYCYSAISDKEPTTQTDEVVIGLGVDNLEGTVPKAKWLVPMALSLMDGEKSDWFVVTERFKNPL
jgi:8-oxo-dGTP diphosphatase